MFEVKVKELGSPISELVKLESFILRNWLAILVDEGSFEENFVVLVENLELEVVRRTCLEGVVQLLALYIKDSFLDHIKANLDTSILEAYQALEVNRMPFKDCLVELAFRLKVVLDSKEVLDQSSN